jgi:hypothetical protein
MNASCGSGAKALIFLMMFAMGAPASAQAVRSSVDMAASAGGPEFRDPKTGQIWTPNNVGLVAGPNTPADRAFDPLAQAVHVDGVIVQRVKITPLGMVPITSGPTVPIVTITDASLRAVPEQRWQVVLYLNNNSGRTIVPLIHCSFTNAGKPVEQTRALVPAVGGGVRVGLTVYGPPTNLFVDRATCRVESP